MHITDLAFQERRLGRRGTTTNTHIQDGVRTDCPQLLGRDVHQDHPFIFARLTDLPATTFHIDGQLSTKILVLGLHQLVL